MANPSIARIKKKENKIYILLTKTKIQKTKKQFSNKFIKFIKTWLKLKGLLESTYTNSNKHKYWFSKTKYFVIHF